MRRLTAASSLVIIVVSSIAGASAQPAMPDYSLYSPIYELSVRLGSRYAKCITVEDAALVWRGEMRRIGLNKDGVEVFGPQPFSLILPGDSPVFSAPALNAAVIQQALDIYARQNPGRTTYKVLESSLGFHIVPAAAHDETGAMHPVRSLLDTPVDVLPAMRTATEHLQAVVNSLSRSTGLAFGEVWNFDGFYAANGYISRSKYPPPEDRPYWLFRWGASEVTAREALIDLMEGSGTTMSWGFGCGPYPTLELRCDLQVSAIQVGVKRAQVYLDRCTKCRLIPK